MRKIVIIYLCFAVLLLMSPNLVILSYGESGCEKSNWHSPLEHDLTSKDVNRPFKIPSHYGTDYKAADGDNVRAVADGTILKKGYDLKNLDRPDSGTGLMTRGWGRYVVVKHKDGSTTLYAHLQKNSTSHLSERMPIGKGDTIGKADSSGGVTGPHLHLEYTPNGKWWSDLSKKDPNPCLVQCPAGSATLAISGPDAPQNGSQYTATGGTAPYTWSISKGSITQAGVVTVSGQCGSATVTATDSCSNTGSKEIRMPSGVWMFVSQSYPYPLSDTCGYSYSYTCKTNGRLYTNPYPPYNTTTIYDVYQYDENNVTCASTEIIGSTKTISYGIAYSNTCGGTATANLPDCIPMGGTCSSSFLGYTQTYEWKCQWYTVIR